MGRPLRCSACRSSDTLVGSRPFSRAERPAGQTSVSPTGSTLAFRGLTPAGRRCSRRGRRGRECGDVLMAGASPLPCSFLVVDRQLSTPERTPSPAPHRPAADQRRPLPLERRLARSRSPVARKPSQGVARASISPSCLVAPTSLRQHTSDRPFPCWRLSPSSAVGECFSNALRLRCPSDPHAAQLLVWPTPCTSLMKVSPASARPPAPHTERAHRGKSRSCQSPSSSRSRRPSGRRGGGARPALCACVGCRGETAGAHWLSARRVRFDDAGRAEGQGVG